MIDYDAPSIALIIAETHKSGLGLGELIKAVRADPIADEWANWTTSQKQEFNRELGFRLRSYASEQYAAERLSQLRERAFSLWIFRCNPGDGDPRFEQLDGITLPPDHPFWTAVYPPPNPETDCYIVGANSDAGARRLGGDPEKPIPSWAIAPE